MLRNLYVNDYMNDYCTASTLRLYNVALPSVQLHDVASTLIWRFINGLCPLGTLLYKWVQGTEFYNILNYEP